MLMDHVAHGARIRARRLQLGLTVREAAPLCGVSFQVLSAIENGANTTIDTLRGIAKGLNVDIEVIITTTDAPVLDGPRLGVAERFRMILPHIPDDELDVFVHELALWEKRYGPKEG